MPVVQPSTPPSGALPVASGFVLHALRRMMSPMHAFAASKAAALGLYFGSLFSGKIAAGWDAAAIRFELVASDLPTLQVAISAGVVVALVAANLALRLRREGASSERVRELAGVLKDPNVPHDIKAKLADQINQDR